MTAPDPKILAEAIKRSEADMQLFRGIDDPEIKKLVEFCEVILVAAKAYGPMREALEAAEEADKLCDEGTLDEWWSADERARSLRWAIIGGTPISVIPKMTAADLGCREQACQQGLGDPPMDCGWPECGCGLRLLELPPAALNPAGPA